MDDSTGLVDLVHAIARGEHGTVGTALAAVPSLATARIARPDEFLVSECRVQVYAGDTALHAAAFAYDVEIARDLVSRGADVRGHNRRGAEPLHAAVNGEPGSESWRPVQQRAVIRS